MLYKEFKPMLCNIMQLHQVEVDVPHFIFLRMNSSVIWPGAGSKLPSSSELAQLEVEIRKLVSS